MPLRGAIMTALAKPVRVLTVYGRRGLGKGCSYSYSPSFLPFCSRHLLTSALFPIPEMLQNVQDERPDCSQGRNYKDDSFQHRRYLLTEAPPATGLLAPQVIIAAAGERF